MTGSTQTKSVDVWSKTAACILLLASCAKLVSQGGSAPILALPDAIIGVSNRQVFLAAGTLELLSAGYLLFGSHILTKCILTLWLGGCFATYRVAIWWAAPGMPCPCLGSLGGWLPFSHATLDWVLRASIAYLIIGSVYFLCLDTVRRRGKP